MWFTTDEGYDEKTLILQNSHKCNTAGKFICDKLQIISITLPLTNVCLHWIPLFGPQEFSA